MDSEFFDLNFLALVALALVVSGAVAGFYYSCLYVGRYDSTFCEKGGAGGAVAYCKPKNETVLDDFRYGFQCVVGQRKLVPLWR